MQVRLIVQIILMFSQEKIAYVQTNNSDTFSGYSDEKLNREILQGIP